MSKEPSSQRMGSPWIDANLESKECSSPLFSNKKKFPVINGLVIDCATNHNYRMITSATRNFVIVKFSSMEYGFNGKNIFATSAVRKVALIFDRILLGGINRLVTAAKTESKTKTLIIAGYAQTHEWLFVALKAVSYKTRPYFATLG